MAAQPTWIMLMPMFLLVLFAVLGLGGFVLQKWIRSQPEAAGAVKFVVLAFGGLLGVLLLGALVSVPVHDRSADQAATIDYTQAAPPVDFESYVHESLPTPHQVTHHTQQVGAPAFAAKWVLIAFVAVCVGAFFLVRVLSLRQRPEGVKLLAAMAVLSVALLVGGLFIIRVRTGHVVEQAATVDYEQMRAIGEQLQRTPAPPPQPERPSEPRMMADAPVSALPVAQNALTPLPTDDRSAVESDTFTPSWVRAGVQRQGDVTTVVCSSKQYASVEEADVDARAAVRDYLLEERRRTIPTEPFGPRTTPSVDHMVSDVVKGRYVETIQRDFGTFFAPMHRVWLRAEITPKTYNNMRAAYTAGLQESRLLVAGSALAALLCVPLGIVTFGRLDRWTNRRFPRILQSTIAAAVLGVWAVGAVVLQQFVTLF